MKYIVEVLQPSNTRGRRTQVYSNKDAAISALDGYKYHRPGQPVIALYNGKEDVEALLAIGTSTSTYYLISGGDEIVNNYFTQISANNVMVDPIDITLLLSEHGPGYDFDTNKAIYESWNGAQRHFGWLGTTAASWATAKEGSNFFTKYLTVQEMFNAILHGTEVNNGSVKPIVTIELSKDNATWTDHLTLQYKEGDPIPNVWVKIACENINLLDSTTEFNIIPSEDFEDLTDLYELFKRNPSGYSYKTENFDISTINEFTITASNEYGDSTDTAILDFTTEDGGDDDRYVVYTDGYSADPISTDTAQVIMNGHSEGFTPVFKYIRIRVKGTDEWENALPIGGGTSTYWKAQDSTISYGVTYEYQAYAVDEYQETHYGNIVEFTISNPEEIKHRFTYYAVPAEAASMTGTLDGTSVGSDGLYDRGDGNKEWTVTREDLKSDEYEFDGWLVTDKRGSGSILSDALTIDGTFDSDTEVCAMYYKKNIPPEDDANYVHVQIKVIVDGAADSPKSDVKTYVDVNQIGERIPKGSSITLTATPKERYAVLGWSQSQNGSHNASDSITINNIGGDMILYVWVNSVDMFTVYADCNPTGAAQMKISGEPLSYKLFERTHSGQIAISYNINAGYEFLYWMENSNDFNQTKTDPVYYYSIPEGTQDSSVHIIGVFKKNEEPTPPEPGTYTLKVAAGSNGTISDETYKNGVTVEDGFVPSNTFTATPNTGYSFTKWMLNGSNYSNDPILEVPAVHSNVTYTAIFSPIQITNYFELETGAPSGIGLNMSSRTKSYGETENFAGIILSPTLEGYSIDYWEDKSTGAIVTSVVVTESKTYVAHLKHTEPQPTDKYQVRFPGADDEDVWKDLSNTISVTKTTKFVYNNVDKYPWTTNSDPQDTSGSVTYYVPCIVNTKLSTNIKIPSNKRISNVYSYVGGWVGDSATFELVQTLSDGKEYSVSTVGRTTILGIKIIDA